MPVLDFPRDYNNRIGCFAFFLPFFTLLLSSPSFSHCHCLPKQRSPPLFKHSPVSFSFCNTLLIKFNVYCYAVKLYSRCITWYECASPPLRWRRRRRHSLAFLMNPPFQVRSVLARSERRREKRGEGIAKRGECKKEEQQRRRRRRRERLQSFSQWQMRKRRLQVRRSSSDAFHSPWGGLLRLFSATEKTGALFSSIQTINAPFQLHF